jgi:hypothetical protein
VLNSFKPRQLIWETYILLDLVYVGSPDIKSLINIYDENGRRKVIFPRRPTGLGCRCGEAPRNWSTHNDATTSDEDQKQKIDDA